MRHKSRKRLIGMGIGIAMAFGLAGPALPASAERWVLFRACRSGEIAFTSENNILNDEWDTGVNEPLRICMTHYGATFTIRYHHALQFGTGPEDVTAGTGVTDVNQPDRNCTPCPLTVGSIIGDDRPETDSNVDVWIDSIEGASTSQEFPIVIRLTIIDNDPTVSTQANLVAPEYDDYPANVYVNLRLDRFPLNKTVCVRARTEVAGRTGEQASTNDYAPFDVRRCFPERVRDQQVLLSIHPDRVPEVDEFLKIVLHSPSPGLTISSPSETLVRIVDDSDG